MFTQHNRKSRQLLASGIKSTYDDDLYPTRLNFYREPPPLEISIEEFEQFALDRMQGTFFFTHHFCLGTEVVCLTATRNNSQYFLLVGIYHCLVTSPAGTAHGADAKLDTGATGQVCERSHQEIHAHEPQQQIQLLSPPVNGRATKGPHQSLHLAPRLLSQVRYTVHFQIAERSRLSRPVATIIYRLALYVHFQPIVKSFDPGS